MVFEAPLQIGCHSCSFCIYNRFVFWQSEAYIPTRTSKSEFCTPVLSHCAAIRTFPVSFLVPVSSSSSSSQRTPDKIFFIRHTNRRELLLRFVYPPASEVIQVFNVDDVCLSFRNRSGCNGIRTGVEEDSSDGSPVGGSCWGYRSAGRGPSNASAIRCTGVDSLLFGGTSGRQRRCILRLLRLIISRVFLPRDLIDSWDI